MLSVADLEKSVTVDDSELRAFYEKNQQQFANTIPEQRKIKYVVIDPARLPNPAKVSSDELQSYYRQHAAEFRVPESVKVRHILIKLPLPGPDGKVDAKQAAGCQGKGAGRAEPASQGRRFRGLGEEVLRRYCDRQRRRFWWASWCRAPVPHLRLRRSPSASPRDRLRI